MSGNAAHHLPLQCLYRWEQLRAERLYLSQPLPDGAIQEWTWAGAVGEARRVAAYLKAQEWPAGSRVAILSKNCAHWLMADFAIWMAGHVSVPLYPTLSAESVRKVLEHSESRALFVGKLDGWESMQLGVPSGVPMIAMPLAPAAAAEGAVLWDEIIRDTKPMVGSPVRAGDELATIIYTSGTTGMPKGVMHSFANFAAAAQSMGETLDLTSDERALSYLPLAHVAERLSVEANSLRHGFRIYFAESMETFLRDIQRARPTLFFSVPRLWTKFQQGVFAKLPKRRLEILSRVPVLGRIIRRKIVRQLGLDHARFVMTGAAPLPAEVFAWYRGLGLEMLEVYGMTENLGLSHVGVPGQVRLGYVGTPWPGVKCRIATTGEVQVRAPSTMLGYYLDPEQTRETLTDDGFLKTGDLGELDEIGRLRITGRAKEQFKTSKGKYVAPAPIENLLGAHPQIEAVCVAGAGYPQPFALVMLPADVAAAAAEPAFIEELARCFEEHMQSVNHVLDPHERLAFIAVVSEQWTVDSGFVTPTMKIRRSAIEAAYARYFDEWRAARAPVVWGARSAAEQDD